MSGSWYDSAWGHIDAVHATLAPDTPFAERRKAISDAYPWGERRMHPYKMWLKAQKRYLARYDPAPAGPLAPVPAKAAGIPVREG
ncbi:hypothetical protein [Kaistia granuli]|uniref:hypothetical protein n=1 Tax=Kaistia granuli TaxID=363259 RepID=UPI00035D7ED2|nr:hypothetical protein [Kaistia granuli]